MICPDLNHEKVINKVTSIEAIMKMKFLFLSMVTEDCFLDTT